MDRLLSSGTIKVNSNAIETVELISQIFSPITDRRARLTETALLEASRILGAVIHNMNSEPEFRVPQQGRWTYRLTKSEFKNFRFHARQLLEKQIKEGEALLEEFEEPQKSTDQITVGIGWYQWSDHEPEEEGE